MNRQLQIWILFLFLAAGCSGQPVYQDLSMDQIMDSLDLGPDQIHIHVDKSDYLLCIRHDSLVLKSFPVVFGGNPEDDKRMQGDQCTPEGSFRIRSKYPHRSWSKFIWIDYPNRESWRKFREAIAKGDIPEDSKIGGEIGIHGVPKGTDLAIDLKMNWTLGCISMKNKHINEIYPHVSEETLVVIEK